MDYLVSVIIPVFNVESYLADCLDSVLMQDYAIFEVLAVNDGSTDSSLEILEKYAIKDPRVKILTQENKGLSAARNTGILHAIGDYVLFIDSDDIVDKELIKTCLDTFLTHKTDMIIFNHAEFNDGNIDFISKIKDLPSGKFEAINFIKEVKKISTTSWCPVCFYAYKKSFIEDHNLNFFEGILHEDVLFTPIALVSADTIAVCPAVLYYYRKRQGSITADPKNARQSLMSYLFVAEQLYQFSLSIGNKQKQEIFKHIVAQRFRFILEYSKLQNSAIGDLVYKMAVYSLRKNKEVNSYFSSEFFHDHLETKIQYFCRLFVEMLVKWPRLIYKYKIKSCF